VFLRDCLDGARLVLEIRSVLYWLSRNFGTGNLNSSGKTRASRRGYTKGVRVFYWFVINFESVARNTASLGEILKLRVSQREG
jgi:hypothetical protein